MSFWARIVEVEVRDPRTAPGAACEHAGRSADADAGEGGRCGGEGGGDVLGHAVSGGLDLGEAAGHALVQAGHDREAVRDEELPVVGDRALV